MNTVYDELDPLPPALAGECFRVPGPAGDITVYVTGEGAPLLLIHSINAAASAAEVRPLHAYYGARRRVFSVDLPGYGLSERSDRAYSPRLMTDAIHQAVTLILRLCGSQPIDALALSLSSEYLARAATERPALFRSVAMVSPTGFQRGARRRRPSGTSLGKSWFYGLLRGPGWGRGIFDLLTRPSVIRYFLRRTWGSRNIDEELWRYDVITARRPGAEHAPLRFLSGYLFSGDVHTVYEALTVPVWMSHGVRGDFTDYGNRQLVAGRGNWRFTTFDSGALPHFERPAEFFAEYDSFLKALPAPASA